MEGTISLNTYIPLGLLIVLISLTAWFIKLHSMATNTRESLDKHLIEDEKRLANIQHSLEKVEDENCTMDGRLIKIETKMDDVIKSMEKVTKTLEVLIEKLAKKK